VFDYKILTVSASDSTRLHQTELDIKGYFEVFFIAFTSKTEKEDLF